MKDHAEMTNDRAGMPKSRYSIWPMLQRFFDSKLSPYRFPDMGNPFLTLFLCEKLRKDVG